MSEDGWNHDLDTGFDSMDREHHDLARALAVLERAVRRGGEAHVIESFLLGLVESTRSHFESEQGLMRRWSYPAFEAHAGTHARLLEDLRGLERRHADGSLQIDAGVIESLKASVMGHIRDMDQALGHYLAERTGPKPT